jgi:hypothetical protein
MADRKPYLIVIYGKDGCPLCERLRHEVDEMLRQEEYSGDFNMHYQNLSTVEGMVAYAKSETVNGQRLPALQVMRYDCAEDVYLKIADSRPERFDKKTGELLVPVYLQLQTDHKKDDPAIRTGDIIELMELARKQTT